MMDNLALSDITDDSASQVQQASPNNNYTRGTESTPLHREQAIQQRAKDLKGIVVGFTVFSAGVTMALLVAIVAGTTEVSEHGAVVSWTGVCSDTGTDMLQQGGSAVDAVIATWLCTAVTKPQSDGLFGGGFMIVHDHKEHKSFLYDFRESAPSKALPSEQTTREKLLISGTGVGVSGSIKAMQQIHSKHGLLAWHSLFQPAIHLASNGFPVTTDHVKDFQRRSSHHATQTASNYKGHVNFMRQLGHHISDYSKVGNILKWPELAATLQILAQDPDRMSAMDSSLVKEIVHVVGDAGGVMTALDIHNYTIIDNRQPITLDVLDMHLVSFPAPSSGALVLGAVKQLVEMHNKKKILTKSQIQSVLSALLRCKQLLGDPDKSATVLNNEHHMRNFSHECWSDATDSPPSVAPEHGTSHISVMDNNELMVAYTGSMNYWFGSMLMSESGILLNNELADFSDTPSNQYQAGARPLSSMTPTIGYSTHKPCDLRFAIGGINGSYISPALSQVLYKLVVDRASKKAEEAISEARYCAPEQTECVNSDDHDAMAVLMMVYKNGETFGWASDQAQPDGNGRIF